VLLSHVQDGGLQRLDLGGVLVRLELQNTVGAADRHQHRTPRRHLPEINLHR
jgi:hypothetical protein